MNLDLGVYVITFFSNIFCTYIIFSLYKLYFKEPKKSDRFIISTIVVYEVIITFCVFLIGIPVILMAINLVMLFLISFCFDATLQRKFIFTSIFLVIFYFAEFISYVIVEGSVQANFFASNEYTFFIMGVFISTMFKYLALILLKKFQKDSIERALPKSSWISILVLLTFSLAISILISYEDIDNYDTVIISLCLLMLMNLIIMNLYNKLNQFYVDTERKNLLEQRNKYYDQQLKMINASNFNIKSVRHDIVNILNMVNICIDTGNLRKAKDYIFKHAKKIEMESANSNSGHFEIDSIVNFKINEMAAKGISLIIDVKVPNKLKTSEIDLVIILGNLLDNAMDATSEVEKNKKVYLSIIYSKSCLTIQVRNPYVGVIKKKGGRFLTRKADKEFHGIGQLNVKNAVKNYNGTLNYEYDNNIFVVTATLYDC